MIHLLSFQVVDILSEIFVETPLRFVARKIISFSLYSSLFSQFTCNFVGFI